MPFLTLILGQCAYLVEVTVRSIDVIVAITDTDALRRSFPAAADGVGLNPISKQAIMQRSPAVLCVSWLAQAEGPVNRVFAGLCVDLATSRLDSNQRRLFNRVIHCPNPIYRAPSAYW